MKSDSNERTARLTEPASTLAATFAFGTELDTYADLWGWLSIADMAHVRCLARASVISAEVEGQLLKGLYETHAEEVPELDPSFGDLYSNRFRFVRDKLGPVVDQIHTGRARREATTLAWHLETRLQIEAARVGVASLIEVLVSVAAENQASAMPDFTYLQHAHPTTLGHYLLTFAYPLLRDTRRLTSALENVNRSPAGSGSVNGSRFSLDREAMARDLEFDGLIVHNRDAMWAPDIALDSVSAVMSGLVTVDRLAEELQLWATAEFGYFEPADRHTRTSVIMPQKKNPYGLAMIRGNSRDQLGRLVSVIATNLTPTGQPDNRVVSYGEVPASLRRLRDASRLLAEHIQHGRFDIERMRRAAGREFTTATEICDWLTMEHGIGNRDAHALVGGAVRKAIERNASFLEISDLKASSEESGLKLPLISDEQLADLQDPSTVITNRLGRGSVKDVPSMVEELTEELNTLPAPRFVDFEERYLSTISEAIDERTET